jgi:hypothetical protein
MAGWLERLVSIEESNEEAGDGDCTSKNYYNILSENNKNKNICYLPTLIWYCSIA